MLCGCTGGDAPSLQASDASSVVDADAAAPVDVPDEGTFACASRFGDGSACNRAAEWCYTNHTFLPTECVPLTSTCEPPGAPDACSSAFTWSDAGCDGGRLSCACVTPTCTEGYCTDDEAGGITVSCGSCYGAPPARLERLAPPSAAASSASARA